MWAVYKHVENCVQPFGDAGYQQNQGSNTRLSHTSFPRSKVNKFRHLASKRGS